MELFAIYMVLINMKSIHKPKTYDGIANIVGIFSVLSCLVTGVWYFANLNEKLNSLDSELSSFEKRQNDFNELQLKKFEDHYENVDSKIFNLENRIFDLLKNNKQR